MKARRRPTGSLSPLWLQFRASSTRSERLLLGWGYDRNRPRLCENSTVARFRGSSHPSQGRDRRIRSNLSGRLLG